MLLRILSHWIMRSIAQSSCPTLGPTTNAWI